MSHINHFPKFFVLTLLQLLIIYLCDDSREDLESTKEEMREINESKALGTPAPRGWLF